MQIIHLVEKGSQDDDAGEIGQTQAYANGPDQGILKNTVVQANIAEEHVSQETMHDVQLVGGIKQTNIGMTGNDQTGPSTNYEVNSVTQG